MFHSVVYVIAVLHYVMLGSPETECCQVGVCRDTMLYRDLYGRDIIRDAGVCRRLQAICLALNAPFLKAS